NYLTLRAAVDSHPVLAGAAFVTFYALAVTVSLPGALWFTIASGLLFGWALGTVYAWAGALTGAVLIFLAARTALRDVLRAKAGSRLDQFKRGFEGDAFFYVLLLRLIPLPFFLVNVAPAFFDVKVRDYALATAIGVIPGALAYAAIGAGAGDIIASGADLTPAALIDPKIGVGVALLAALTLGGLWLKKRREAMERGA
ncbi:MAG: VTT domain-containing protein, partial [Caulobacterales bacterium]|nr:VTT domain-containing protein [Caulobacterales bacterium]